MRIFQNEIDRINDNTTSEFIEFDTSEKLSNVFKFILDENVFCRMNRIEKKIFVDKWKSLKNEVKFTIGKININNEKKLMDLLKNNNIVCSCFKSPAPDKSFLYMSCTTKDNCIILFEMQILKKDYFYAEIKYKSETNQKETLFENYLMMLLTYYNSEGDNENECLCR